MGSSKQPSYNPPAPPKLPTADEIYASATNYAKANQPLAFGARENLLQNFQTPEATNQFFNAFQPSSFEQALANQNFQNLLPESENRIKAYLSQAGIASSPVTARLLADNYNKLGVDVGSYLSNLGNQRALTSINTQNIDPNSITQPFANTAMTQGNNQASLDYGYQQALAQQQYQQALDKYNSQLSLARTLGMFSPIGGAIYGGATQGGQGFASSLGGSAQTLQAALPFLSSGTNYGVGALFSPNLFRSPSQQVENVFGNTPAGYSGSINYFGS